VRRTRKSDVEPHAVQKAYIAAGYKFSCLRSSSRRFPSWVHTSFAAILPPGYNGWFTEGFNTLNLEEAAMTSRHGGSHFRRAAIRNSVNWGDNE
jgi:hypothetical protein